MTAELDKTATPLTALRSLLGQMGVGRSSLLEYITGSWENGREQVAYAFLKHSQDILFGNPVISDLELMIECYRLTFFDREGAARYGTEALLMNDEMAYKMVEHMTALHEAEKRGSPAHPEAAGRH